MVPDFVSQSVSDDGEVFAPAVDVVIQKLYQALGFNLATIQHVTKAVCASE